MHEDGLPEKLVETHIPGCHPRELDSVGLGMGPGNLHSTRSPGKSGVCVWGGGQGTQDYTLETLDSMAPNGLF